MRTHLVTDLTKMFIGTTTRELCYSSVSFNENLHKIVTFDVLELDDLFHFLYFDFLKIDKHLFNYYEIFLNTNEVSFIENPLIYSSDFSQTLNLMWRLHTYQKGNFRYDLVDQYKLKEENNIFEYFTKYPQAYTGIEIDRNTMEHKHVIYNDEKGPFFNIETHIIGQL